VELQDVRVNLDTDETYFRFIRPFYDHIEEYTAQSEFAVDLWICFLWHVACGMLHVDL